MFPGWRIQGHDLPTHPGDCYKNAQTCQSATGLQQRDCVLFWPCRWHTHLCLHTQIHRNFTSLFLYTEQFSTENNAREGTCHDAASVSWWMISVNSVCKKIERQACFQRDWHKRNVTLRLVDWQAIILFSHTEIIHSMKSFCLYNI